MTDDVELADESADEPTEGAGTILAVYQVTITLRLTEAGTRITIDPPINADVASVCGASVEALVGASRVGSYVTANARSQRTDA